MADPPETPPDDAQQPGDQHHDESPPADPQRLTLPDDPDRWERGDWAFDPIKDKAWESPEILRRRIGTPEELAAVADAVVRGYAIAEIDSEGEQRKVVDDTGWITRYALIEELQALIEAVESHHDVRLAHAEWEDDADGFMRAKRRWVTDRAGNELPARPKTEETRLFLNNCVIARALCTGCDIRIGLFAHTQIVGEAAFESARFIGVAWFEKLHTSKTAWFMDTCFCGETSFDHARFTGDVWFRNSRCAGLTWFEDAHFAREAIFDGARYTEKTSFARAHFDMSSTFENARFAGMASFENTRFAGDALFIYTCFARMAWFANARFARSALFLDTQFEGIAIIWNTRFAGETRFRSAHFSKDVDFTRLHVSNVLDLTGARFRQNAKFADAQFYGFPGHDTSGNRILGGLYLTGVTLNERLNIRGAQFYRRARLGLHRFLAVGDATIEMDYEQLRPEKRARRVVEERFKRPARGGWKRAAFNVLSWFGFVKRPAFIAGEDSDDPQALCVAAEDYELLAANFKKLAATDDHEDWCRLRAKELHRRADLIEAGPRAMGPVAMREGWLRDLIEPWIVVGRSAWFVAHEVCWRWLIERTMLGYLLQMHRIVVTGLVLMLVCGAVFGLFASPETVSYNGTIPLGIDAGAYAMEQWNQPEFRGSLADLELSWLYFSLTTFVTLGYGDFAPLGWFKLVTGIEALLGVTLVALFTVAWGRKLVR